MQQPINREEPERNTSNSLSSTMTMTLWGTVGGIGGAIGAFGATAATGGLTLPAILMGIASGGCGGAIGGCAAQQVITRCSVADAEPDTERRMLKS